MGGVGEFECWKEGIRGQSTAEGRGGPQAGGCRVQRNRKERGSEGKGGGRSRRCPVQDTTSNL